MSLLISRPLAVAFSCSLALHGSAGLLSYWQARDGSESPQESIMISHVNFKAVDPDTEKLPVPAALKAVPPQPPKVLSAPKPKRSQAIARTLPSERQKSNRIATPVPISAPPIKARMDTMGPKTSQELLADPKKSKPFTSYFAAVKQRIYETLKNHDPSQAGGSGEVALYFILNPNGRLAKMEVVDGQSVSDVVLRELALDCLKRSAPFDVFPQELQSSPIAFLVKIYFEEWTP